MRDEASETVLQILLCNPSGTQAANVFFFHLSADLAYTPPPLILVAVVLVCVTFSP